MPAEATQAEAPSPIDGPDAPLDTFDPRAEPPRAHPPRRQHGGLLKETLGSQLFTSVFGSPRTTLTETNDGQFHVRLDGVDIYDPVENTIRATDVGKVAAWFVDSDYDGRTFCITQA